MSSTGMGVDGMGVASFIYEIGLLKRTPRAGWFSVGISSPESVAEHSFRTAVIGLVLSLMEGADEDKVVKMCLLHDIHESRLGDITRRASRYVKGDVEAALKDVLVKAAPLKDLEKLIMEYRRGRTKEAILAKDADLLDMLAQAVEYQTAGNKNLGEWIKDTRGRIRSRSGRKVAKELLTTSPVRFLKD